MVLPPPPFFPSPEPEKEYASPSFPFSAPFFFFPPRKWRVVLFSFFLPPARQSIVVHPPPPLFPSTLLSFSWLRRKCDPLSEAYKPVPSPLYFFFSLLPGERQLFNASPSPPSRLLAAAFFFLPSPLPFFTRMEAFPSFSLFLPVTENRTGVAFFPLLPLRP